jgi:hypothetical protein
MCCGIDYDDGTGEGGCLDDIRKLREMLTKSDTPWDRVRRMGKPGEGKDTHEKSQCKLLINI